MVKVLTSLVLLLLLLLLLSLVSVGVELTSGEETPPLRTEDEAANVAGGISFDAIFGVDATLEEDK